jgi:hypothetical protein
MADQVDAIIRIRRGPDGERRLITFDPGEIVHSTDNKHTFIGDGRTAGGWLVGNLNYFSTSPNPSAVIGDLYYSPSNSALYMLSADTGADNLSSYVRLTPGRSNTVKYEDGKYEVNDDFINELDNKYVNIDGDTMTGPLIMDNTQNTYINVKKITSNSTILIEKPIITTLKTYNEVVSSSDVKVANPYVVVDLSACNNFCVNLYTNVDYIRVKNAPADGASFTLILNHKANNLTINWRLSTDTSPSYIIPKWQLGKLPMTSKIINSEDAVAFVYMNSKWYGFICAVNMTEPVGTTIS